MAEKIYKTILPDAEFWRKMIPCQYACPIHTDAGKYVQLIAEGKDRESYLTARSPNPFASVCGRICAAPCEDACRRGKIDAPVSIRALKRFVAEKFGVESNSPDTQEELLAGGHEPGNKWDWHLPLQIKKRGSAPKQKGSSSARKVAVIGSGPAGMSAAHDLALLGYAVTIFEASPIAGGMMRHGIPAYRLPREIIDQEISRVQALGVELRVNAPLGEKFGLRELRAEGFEAFFISVGTQKGRDLKIAGADKDGVVRAIDYLLNINNGYRMNLGRRIVVIGGGFVAFDAARTALRAGLEESGQDLKTALDAARLAKRAGALDVHIVSLESFDEMPVLKTTQGHEEFAEAQKEGIQFHPRLGPKRILGNGRVTGIELMQVTRVFDENGKFNPAYNSEATQQLEADAVILAIGQQADLSFIRPADGVEVTPANTIKVDRATLATSAPGVYAGGDVAFGPRNLIEAIANGKQAAKSIDRFLRGEEATSTAESFKFFFEKIPTGQYKRPESYDKCERQAPPTISLDRRTGISEVETGYADAEARQQAERCLYCHIQTVYDADKCVMCNRCVDICPEYCLKLVPVEQLDLPEDQLVKLHEHYGHDALATLSAMIKDDEKCIRCGLCAIRCPTDAMTMEMMAYEPS
jgi:NADPH-dependent glutamate synthase beta subunit-like oxidoreductase